MVGQAGGSGGWKAKNFSSDDIVDCIESVEGKKKKDSEDGSDE